MTLVSKPCLSHPAIAPRGASSARTNPVRHLSLSGFTLIELLVVLVIVSLVLTLVGPLAVRDVQRNQRHVEQIKLENWLTKQGHRAFYLGQPLTVIADGQQLNVYRGRHHLDDEQSSQTDLNQQSSYDQWQLEHLEFHRQTVLISSRGFPQTPQLVYQSSGQTFTIDLVELLYRRGSR